MICDTIHKAGNYHSLSVNIEKALKYLQSTDLSKVEDGRHEINGDDVFALVFGYDTKNEEDCITEAHFRHIDVHYLIEGEEYLGVANLDGQTPTEVNEEKDYSFYKTELNYIRMTPGMFAILFPWDIHLTGKKVDEPKPLRKVVIKVKMKE